ncbi:MAG: hypothetical protein AB7E52_07225 [Bdellovibrionales bacterium]
MTHTLRNVLLASTALGFLVVAPSAHAADSTAEAIKALQAQVDALQKQLVEIQAKAQQTAPVSAEPAKVEKASSETGKKEILPGVSVKFGGYIAAEGVYRDRSQNGDMSTSYSGVTLGHTADSSHGEFRASARTTRLSALFGAKIDKDTDLGGYIEGDFLGASGSYAKTNNFSPRLRQGFISYDRNDWGFHAYAGQAYSLTTSSKSGMSPRTEDLPMVVDAALVPGVVYTRNAQFRVVKDFADNTFHAGLSFESPEVSVPSTLPTNTSSSHGDVPDVIAKVAYDNSFGHVELFGLTRFFTATYKGATYENDRDVAFSGGVSTFMHVLPKKLDFHANFAAGKGLGRYTIVGMPGYTITADGKVKSVTAMAAMVGLIGHLTPSLDAYLYAGAEKAIRQSHADGYGVGVDNSGCYTPTGSCAGVTESVWTLAPGVWDTVYKGDYGSLKVGAQYSLTRRDGFSDSNGQPHAYENVGLISFRYSPF